MSDNEKNWVQVTPSHSIPPREGRCVEIAGRQVAIFHTSEGFLAVENRCPHRGGPLSDGIVNGVTVVCPLHAWKFDLRSGVSSNHPESSVSLITYPVRIQGGIICIEFPRGMPGGAATVACEHRDRPIRWVQRKSTTAAARPGDLTIRGSSDVDMPRTERPDNGYVPQEL